MALRIAALHRCSVSSLPDHIPDHEYPLWVAFYELEPWGYMADNYHSSLVASQISTASGAPAAPADFMDLARKIEPIEPSPESSNFNVDDHTVRLERVL
ncbi:MAG: phage tail assembly protein T [Cellvibrionaceae bacterium]